MRGCCLVHGKSHPRTGTIAKRLLRSNSAVTEEVVGGCGRAGRGRGGIGRRIYHFRGGCIWRNAWIVQVVVT